MYKDFLHKETYTVLKNSVYGFNWNSSKSEIFVRLLWGTSANFFFNFQEFHWNDWFFFFCFVFFSAQICASLMDGSHLFFPFDSIFIPLYLFFSKRWIYVNSKSETTTVWCDVLVPSLCAICWHGVPYLKHTLVPEGEQSHFVVVPFLKQADGKKAAGNLSRPQGWALSCFAMMFGKAIPVMKALGSTACEGWEMQLCCLVTDVCKFRFGCSGKEGSISRVYSPVAPLWLQKWETCKLITVICRRSF